MVTKSALIHLSKALAVIAAPNIRVNTLSPGLLMTEWGMKFPEEKRKAAQQASKLKRFATVEVRTMCTAFSSCTDARNRTAPMPFGRWRSVDQLLART